MRAAVLERYDAPLTLVERPVPTPRPGEVLLAVGAVGLCGTDLKLIGGRLPGTRLPLIPGHEIAGTVVAGDPELEGLRAGCYLYESCGRCRACRVGHPTCCDTVERLGLERDGGLAEFVAVPRDNVLPFPDEVDVEGAALAMDAVMTPWAALHRHADVRPQSFVLIVGAGGVGIHAIQIAKILGAHVAVLEPSVERRAQAIELGAELAVHPDDVHEVATWSGGGVDVALEGSGTGSGFAAAMRSLRPGGRVVCSGYQPGVEHGLSSAALVLGEFEVVGSRAGRRDDARDALAAVVAGEVTPQISHVMPLECVNDALELLRGGRANGRVVVRL
jgi:propanol-preferring alcohol dehydrogenase